MRSQLLEVTPTPKKRQKYGKIPKVLNFTGTYVGNNGLHQIKSRIRIGARRSSSGDSLFADDNVFHVRFTRMIDLQSPAVGPGDVVAYRATTQLNPLAVYSAACDGDRGDKIQAWEYVEFFRELEMIFSLAQVEDILLDRDKWNLLNLEGGSNVFMVANKGRCYVVIARRAGKRWYLKDSVAGMGRGYDPGAQFLFRNKSDLSRSQKGLR
jgi:hypothetical protein